MPEKIGEYMVDPRLIAYVRQQRQNGYSDAQIAQALRSQQYPESLISSALSSAASPTAADSNLLSMYVQTYLQQGYTQEQIRAGLIEQGYAEKDIARAMQKKAPAHHTKGLIIFPLIAILVLIGGYFFITLDPITSTPPPTVETSSVRLGEIIDNLLPLAQRNPAAALALCDNVVEGDQGRCILSVSREASNPQYCPQIADPRLRDTCYLEFIYDGNLEYCSQLQLEGNIEYCKTIKALTTTQGSV